MSSFRRPGVLGLFVLAIAACGGSPGPDPATPSSAAAPGAHASGSSPTDAGFAIASAAAAVKTVPAADGPLGKGLAETSAWFAAGMTADGPAMLATLGPSGHARSEISLRAGKCYVVVGFALDGTVTDFDLTLWKKGPPPSMVAQDSDDGTTPTIGKPPMCADADTDYLLELVADKGKGDVAVQLYSKAR